METKITWEVVHYIRDLYTTTDYTMVKLARCVKHAFKIDIDFTTVHKICRNQRWYDAKYVPPNKPYRKITTEIKEFILESKDTADKIVKNIKDKFNCEISITRVKQLREKINNNISLVMRSN